MTKEQILELLMLYYEDYFNPENVHDKKQKSLRAFHTIMNAKLSAGHPLVFKHYEIIGRFQDKESLLKSELKSNMTEILLYLKDIL